MPQSSCLNSNDRIVAGIEGPFLAEHLDADQKFLELFAATRQLLFDHETKKTLEPFDGLKRFARKDPIQLLSESFLGLLARRRRRGPAGHDLNLRQRRDFRMGVRDVGGVAELRGVSKAMRYQTAC
jgi:hypothetical protein